MPISPDCSDQNPQLRDRLADYPMFISLTERDDFKRLGQNTEFQNAWKQNAPIRELLGNEQFKSMWENQETVKLVWGIVQDNFDDLCAYLQTGQSAKYGSEGNCRTLGFQHRRDHEPVAGNATSHFVARDADAARLGDAIVCQDRVRRRRRWPGVPEKSASSEISSPGSHRSPKPPRGRVNGKVTAPSTNCRSAAAPKTIHARPD